MRQWQPLQALLHAAVTRSLEAGKWVLLQAHGGDELVRAEPFDAVEIDLLRLWGESRG